MSMTDTENSDVDTNNVNRFGQNKTSRWNRPKVVVPLKDLEKVPTRRSKCIHDIQRDKSQAQVKLMCLFYHRYR